MKFLRHYITVNHHDVTLENITDMQGGEKKKKVFAYLNWLLFSNISPFPQPPYKDF